MNLTEAGTDYYRTVYAVEASAIQDRLEQLGVDYTREKFKRDCPADGPEGRLEKGESVLQFCVDSGSLLALMAVGKL